jgi:deoxyinosine 3'endonuclease (endonuclease V)
LLKTQKYANPIVISPGHLISLNKSIELSKKTIISPHKLPEPLFFAHKTATREKKKIRLIVKNELKTRS